MKFTNLALPVLVAIFLAGTGVSYFKSNSKHPTSDTALAKTSVMITRMDGRSGGSGVVLSSSQDGSKILTNAHVCAVIKNGGVLKTENKQAYVVSYQVSEVHDLCLINTKTDLGVDTEVATSSSEPFTPAIIVGHPQLYPTIITKGHFSRYMMIQVMTGIRPCTDEELNSDVAIVCLFLGGIPVIKNYESQMVSATIQAGSSGSPVFNSNGEIGGLVFAGAGDLSYGFIVPQEYVLNFLKNEVPKLEKQVPDTTLDIRSLLNGSNQKRNVRKLLEECEKTETPTQVKEICNNLIKSAFIF